MFGGVLFFVVLSYYLFKGGKKLISRLKPEKKYNFYLEHHKSKTENDKQYKEYLDYLSKYEPESIPKEKQKSIDEMWWEAKIDELVN